MRGDDSVFTNHGSLLAHFPRLQLNFAKTINDGQMRLDLLIRALLAAQQQFATTWQFVFQLPSFDNYTTVLAARAAGLDAYGFFDPSAGTGRSPTNGVWPPPPAKADGVTVGWAGGLGPANLKTALDTFCKLAPDGNFWVDMETNVRTDNVFDFDKVNACIAIARPFLRPTPASI